jgi:putative peptide zinc metalloprotease protein
MMESLFSALWYRVADLTPRIRSHANIHRHRYRDETWYVLHDLASGRAHRFSPACYLVIGLMDGGHTIQEIWDTAMGRLGDDAPTQDEMIQLLSQLHSADVLQCDVSPDAAEVFERFEKQQRKKLFGQLMSPLWWRIPLVDPERFLTRLLPWVRPFIGVAGACVWAILVGVALVLATVHWKDLTAGLLDRLMLPSNLIILWCLFPFLKTFHEIGHGLAIKAFGGEVHDMGVMFLVFSPLPYVDASTSSAFASKWQRIAVGAGGMVAELLLAALALFVWLAAEPGLVRSLAYNVVLIAGVSTVLFNGNPLLRYDGYYVLADLLEIPNLYQRSRTYLGYLCERYLFGHREAERPPDSPSERVWFVVYAVSSFVYRIFVIMAIALFLFHKAFYLGMVAVAALLGAWLVVPAWKGIQFLVASPRLRRIRVRAIAISVALVGGVIAGIALVPFPSRTGAEGVVWVPEDALVRAAADGFVERLVARPGSHVRPGDLLLVCRDPQLTTQVEVLEARLRELRARYDEQQPVDRVKAAMVLEEARYVEQDLAKARQQLADLTVRSRVDGSFVVDSADDLPGRFVRRGELLGQVVTSDTITVRAIVAQENTDLVRHHTQRVEVRLSERTGETLLASIKREVPGASERLPSAALGHGGGGTVAVDPRDSHGITAMEKVFQIDLELPVDRRILNVGGRVYVRFDHGWEPLAVQWARQLRQLFLARLNV